MSGVGPALNGITVGSWFNAMLYMLEIVQLTTYINNFWSRDKLPIRIVVILCFIIDTACTIAICSWVFMWDVIYWGDVASISVQGWPVPMKVLCTTLVGALVQSFLISRYYVLSRQRYISLILAFFMISSLAGGVSVAVVLIFYSSIADRYKGTYTTTTWLVSSSLADVSIALFLVLALMRAGAKTSIRSTKALIRRLIFVAIQSGTLTTLLAIGLLCAYLTHPMTNDSAYFSFCLGRAYTLTMLFNLNIRTSIERSRAGSSGGVTIGGSAGSGGGGPGYGYKRSAGYKGSDPALERGGKGATAVAGVREEVYHLGGIQVQCVDRVEKDGKAPFENSAVSNTVPSHLTVAAPSRPSFSPLSDPFRPVTVYSRRSPHSTPISPRLAVCVDIELHADDGNGDEQYGVDKFDGPMPDSPHAV